MGNIYSDLEQMKLVAIHLSNEHHCNYNIIILNPNDKKEFEDKTGQKL